MDEVTKAQSRPETHEEEYTQTRWDKAESRERLGGWAEEEDKQRAERSKLRNTKQDQERRTQNA